MEEKHAAEANDFIDHEPTPEKAILEEIPREERNELKEKQATEGKELVAHELTSDKTCAEETPRKERHQTDTLETREEDKEKRGADLLGGGGELSQYLQRIASIEQTDMQITS